MSRPAHIPDVIPVMLVTPEMAKEWLDTRKTEYERQVRQGRVDGMTRDMLDGKFHFIGDPIRFDTADGALVDGQHRLLAIASSGTSQYFSVVNVPAEAQHVIDTGAKRSVPDMLRKLGISLGGQQGNIIAAIANKLHFYDLGVVGSRGRYRLTADESVTYIRRNEGLLVVAAEIGQQVVKYRLPVSPSTIGTLWALCHRISPEDATSFWLDQVVKGELIEEGDPAWAYRNRALAEHRAGRRIDPDNALQYGAVAWNHYRDGNIVTRLQAPKGGFSNRAVTLR